VSVRRPETAAPRQRPAATRPSLAELYEAHVGRAVALARLLTGDPFAAEDLAHDAFIRAAGRFGRLRDPAAFDAYLRRVVVNLCRMRFRRLRLERRQHAVGGDQIAQPAPEIEERDELWELILRLPYRQRAAVVLRFYEDLSEQQAGEILRCSPRAINALVSRAMAMLRDELGGVEQ
jgi:RNA polymerase sigma-70 factor (sigma-E family)